MLNQVDILDKVTMQVVMVDWLLRRDRDPAAEDKLKDFHSASARLSAAESMLAECRTLVDQEIQMITRRVAHLRQKAVAAAGGVS